MIIQCKSCIRKFIVRDIDIPKSGRVVKCGYCSVTWHQMPIISKSKNFEIKSEAKSTSNINKTFSTDVVRGSDGKMYKYLGTQWARLLPSGKTGIFAKKNISSELNKMTGRKEKTVSKKRSINISQVNPSSEMLGSEKNLPDVYSVKKGLGFFGYIFILTIIGFSVVGFLKTFENDLISYFPESQYFFEILDQQLEFLVETINNMIVISKDLLTSY